MLGDSLGNRKTENLHVWLDDYVPVVETGKLCSSIGGGMTLAMILGSLAVLACGRLRNFRCEAIQFDWLVHGTLVSGCGAFDAALRDETVLGVRSMGIQPSYCIGLPTLVALPDLHEPVCRTVTCFEYCGSH